jgi:GT2 family glycosyltransferase
MVLDNGSGDDSPTRIAEAMAANGWGQWASLQTLEKNLGFAGGNNVALASLMGTGQAEVDYVLLLNSDTQVRPGALAHCRAVMERTGDIGMMSCMLLNGDGSPQNVTRKFPTPLRQTLCALGLPWLLPRLFAWADVYDVPAEQLRQKRDCDWLGGAFMFIRRRALEEVGPMNPAFFFYGEDIEFCWRFHRGGWRVHYDPAAAIVHFGGSSSDPARLPAKMRSLYMWQARYLVQRRCYGWAAAWLVRGADILALGLRKTKMWLSGRRRSVAYRDVSNALALLLRPLGP